MPKQYVNLPADLAKGHGRGVVLKLKATETKPGSSDGQKVYAFLDPDGKNEDATFLRAAHRASAFFTKPPHAVSATFKEKKANAVALLSVAGGDKFGWKYGKEQDGSDAKAASGEKIEVWRKVYARVGHMAGCKSVDPTSHNGKLAKLFLEIENVGGIKEIPHQALTRGVVAAVGELDKVGGPAKDPDVTLNLVFVDRIADPADLKWDFDMTPGQVPKGRKFRIKVKDDELTWPFDDWLVSGKIYLFNSAGNMMADELIHPYVSRPEAGRFHKHKEGVATNRLLFDLSTFPNIERWMQEKSGTMKVYVNIKYIGSVSGGLASPTAPNIVLASRDGYTYKEETLMPRILLHEMGHALGNVLRNVGRWTADQGTSDDHDVNSHWYEKHGGVGNHCHQGSTLVNGKYKAGGGACVMYHGVPGLGEDFCDSCQKIIKRAPLQKLGRLNVWGADAWKQ